MFHFMLHYHVTHATSSIPISVEFLLWAVDKTKWCNDKWPQIDRVHHHLQSIGFEVSLTDSLAYHFLDYLDLCVRCARFMRKFAPTKTFKAPSKNFKTPTKTIKRLQIPKKRSLCFLYFFLTMPKHGINWAFCNFKHSSHRIKSLEEAWLWWQVWTLCAHHHVDEGARLIYFVGDNLKTPVFFQLPICIN